MGLKQFYEYRFLSDDIALSVRKVTTDPKHVALLHDYGLKWQLADAIIRVGGLMSITPGTVIEKYHHRDS